MEIGVLTRWRSTVILYGVRSIGDAICSMQFNDSLLRPGVYNVIPSSTAVL